MGRDFFLNQCFCTKCCIVRVCVFNPGRLLSIPLVDVLLVDWSCRLCDICAVRLAVFVCVHVLCVLRCRSAGPLFRGFLLES